MDSTAVDGSITAVVLPNKRHSGSLGEDLPAKNEKDTREARRLFRKVKTGKMFAADITALHSTFFDGAATRTSLTQSVRLHFMWPGAAMTS